jgi:hypothetical protein
VETSIVRQRLIQTIDRAKRAAAARRERGDEAARAYERFLSERAIPLFRQIAGALKASGHPFSIVTPAGSVRLASDRSGEDFIELSLDTSGERPLVMAHTSRTRGRRTIESEAPVSDREVDEISEDDLLTFVMRELEPFVER